MIDVTLDGVSSTPRDIAELLGSKLTYTHKTYLRGRDAYDYHNGVHTPVQLENRALYAYSHDGKLTTQAGYMPRVARLLKAAGYEPRLCDLSGPRRRPDCYVADYRELTSRMSLRVKQPECLAAMLASAKIGLGGIIWAPTGFGKTHLIEAWSLLHPKANIDIVVKPVAVAERIVRQLSRTIPDVGQIGGGQRRRGRVTVTTADSLHLANGDVDYVICDEAHQLLTDRLSEQIATTYTESINYGLSATPYSRSDGAHARLEGLFGQLLFRMTYQEAVELGLVVQLRVKWLPVVMDNNPAANRRDTAKKQHGIWRNTYRNKIIADAANTYRPDQQVLILVETVEHAIHLRQQLPDYTLCYATLAPGEFAEYVQKGLLPSNEPRMIPARREDLRKAFEAGDVKKVIATDVWSTGVDFASLSVLIRADARGSEIMDTQGPGRASRIHDGKEYGEVIDLIDYFDSSFLGKSKGRFATYDSLGWEQDWPQTGRRPRAS